MKKVIKFFLSGYLLVALLGTMQWFFWNGIKIGEGEDVQVIWEGTRSEKPDLSIVPKAPTVFAVKALTFGDDQFYFRKTAFDIQNAGDTFGRTTSLQDYDYSELYKWWMILDGLDPVSNFVPPLVSYYFGSSQKPERDLPYVIDYLEQHADRNPARKWWWYSQAIYHSKHKLKDLDRSLLLAEKLADIPADAGAPLWVRQMPAFILEARGDLNEACEIIVNIIRDNKNIKPGEMNFMMYFIKERISAMAEEKKNNPNFKIDPRCNAIIEADKKAKAEQEAAEKGNVKNDLEKDEKDQDSKKEVKI